MSNYLPGDSFKVCSYFTYHVSVMWAYKYLCVMVAAAGTYIYWTTGLCVQENGNVHIYLLRNCCSVVLLYFQLVINLKSCHFKCMY